MAIRSETDLYLPVKTFFEDKGYVVKGEVKDCDLVAYHADDEEPIIVELKKTFNLALLFQGIERLKLSRQVYLAVQIIKGQKRPVHLRWSNIKQLCLRLGLGLITVQFYKTKKPHVEILCDPIPIELEQHHNVLTGKSRASRKKIRLRNEFNERSGDYNIGGSTQTKIVTAYRELSLQIAHLLQHHGQLSPLKLRELTGKQKVNSMLQKNYYGWFERVKHGVYALTDEGEAALITYKDIIKKHPC